LVGRIIATRTPRVARASSLTAGVLYITVGVLPLLIGLSGSAFQFNIADAEQVVPLIARELMPTLVYAAFVGAIISAILSTVDSTLLTAAGIFSHNLVIPLARITVEQQKILVARSGVLLFGIIAYLLALSADGVFALVELASAFGSAGAFVAICFGLFTRFGGPHAALATIIVGAVGYVAFSGAGISAPFLTALGISIVTYVAVGLAEPRFTSVSRDR
jgi:Na+/proline symporter